MASVRPKAALAGLVCAALVLTSPGLEAWAAAGEAFGAPEAPDRVTIPAVPDMAAPLAVPQADAGMAVPEPLGLAAAALPEAALSAQPAVPA